MEAETQRDTSSGVEPYGRGDQCPLLEMISLDGFDEEEINRKTTGHFGK